MEHSLGVSQLYVQISKGYILELFVDFFQFLSLVPSLHPEELNEGAEDRLILNCEQDLGELLQDSVLEFIGVHVDGFPVEVLCNVREFEEEGPHVLKSDFHELIEVGLVAI